MIRPDPDPVLVLQDACWRETERLLFHHTNPWELDEALVDWGFLMGPCEAQDLVGLDVVLQRQGTTVSPVLPRMVAEGRMGKKGGVGFYRYPGSGGAVIDPLIEDLIREEAWFAKLMRHEVSDAALVAQMVAAIADAARALEEKHDIHRAAVESALFTDLHFPQAKMGEIWKAAP